MKRMLALEKSILLISGLHGPLIEAWELLRKDSALKQMLVNDYGNIIGGTVVYVVWWMKTIFH